MVVYRRKLTKHVYCGSSYTGREYSNLSHMVHDSLLLRAEKELRRALGIGRGLGRQC